MLYRWALHVTKGAENAAVAFQRPEKHTTRRAVIVKLAGVGRHPFPDLVATLGAGQGRKGFKFDSLFHWQAASQASDC